MRVAIIQRVLPHYRLAFFKALHAALAARGIELQLVYGQEAPGTVPRTVDLETSWACKVQNRYLDVWGMEVVWQPCSSLVRGAELVVVEQANRALVNYLFLAERLVSSRPRLAYWGHGRNFQSTARQRHAEAMKRRLVRAADWWFAYTELSAQAMRTHGVPPEKISVVDNTVDTEELADAVRDIGPAELASTRAQLGIPDDAPIVLYCGGLHPGKNISFLLQGCEAARELIPTMHLVVVGDGPEEHKVNAAAARHSWIHAIGPVFGSERARYFAIAEALLLPAHVGLAIIDSFVTQTPLITTDNSNHSPEAWYLENEVNGLIAAASIPAYATAIVRYLRNESLRATLRAGCAIAARRYTLDNMVERFASGIVASLGAAPGSPT